MQLSLMAIPQGKVVLNDDKHDMQQDINEDLLQKGQISYKRVRTPTQISLLNNEATLKP